MTGISSPSRVETAFVFDISGIVHNSSFVRREKRAAQKGFRCAQGRHIHLIDMTVTMRPLNCCPGPLCLPADSLILARLHTTPPVNQLPHLHQLKPLRCRRRRRRPNRRRWQQQILHPRRAHRQGVGPQQQSPAAEQQRPDAARHRTPRRDREQDPDIVSPTRYRSLGHARSIVTVWRSPQPHPANRRPLNHLPDRAQRMCRS